jgi:hypothetical protein
MRERVKGKRYGVEGEVIEVDRKARKLVIRKKER